MNINKNIYKKRIALIIIFIAAAFICGGVLFLINHFKQPEWKGATFYEYSAYEKNLDTYITLYMGLKNGKVYAIAKGHIKEIDLDCSLCFIHECSQELFEKAKIKIETEYAEKIHGETKNPDLEGYPDLSMYIPIILSYDDRHEIWKEFGIEE